MTLSGYTFATKTRIDNRKKKRVTGKQQYLLQMSHNMVNFGLLAPEIGPVVWGTPANFNGFHVLAALLHGSQVVGVIKTLRLEQRAPPMFCRATITLGIGPHSSFCCFSCVM